MSRENSSMQGLRRRLLLEPLRTQNILNFVSVNNTFTKTKDKYLTITSLAF